MIEIDHSDVLIPPTMFQRLRGAATDLVEATAQSARNHWIKLASADQSSFKNDYIRGIKEVETSAGEVSVSLVGEVPHMLEDGTPQTDLRDILLNPKVTKVVPRGERGMHRNKAGGLYRSIPYRHTIPGTVGAVGQEMGSPYRDVVEDWKKMGQEVYQTMRDMYKQARSGEKVRLPAGVGGAVPMKNPTTGIPHKADIYEGMQRFGDEGHTQYMTFRTISTSVQDGSWIRKAINARHYAVKVAEFAAKIIEHAIKGLEQQ